MSKMVQNVVNPEGRNELRSLSKLSLVESRLARTARACGPGSGLRIFKPKPWARSSPTFGLAWPERAWLVGPEGLRPGHGHHYTLLATTMHARLRVATTLCTERAPDVDYAYAARGRAAYGRRAPFACHESEDTRCPLARRRRALTIDVPWTLWTLLARQGDSDTTRGGSPHSGHAVCAAGGSQEGPWLGETARHTLSVRREARTREDVHGVSAGPALSAAGAIAAVDGGGRAGTGSMPSVSSSFATPSAGAPARVDEGPGCIAQTQGEGGAALQTRSLWGELRDHAARTGSSARKSASRAQARSVRLDVAQRRRAGTHAGVSDSSFTRSAAGDGAAACAPNTLRRRLRGQDAPRGGTPDRVRDAESAGAHHLRMKPARVSPECVLKARTACDPHSSARAAKWREAGRRLAGIPRNGEARTYGVLSAAVEGMIGWPREVVRWCPRARNTYPATSAQAHSLRGGKGRSAVHVTYSRGARRARRSEHESLRAHQGEMRVAHGFEYQSGGGDRGLHTRSRVQPDTGDADCTGGALYAQQWAARGDRRSQKRKGAATGAEAASKPCARLRTDAAMEARKRHGFCGMLANRKMAVSGRSKLTSSAIFDEDSENKCPKVNGAVGVEVEAKRLLPYLEGGLSDSQSNDRNPHVN
ncbi:hypothetical protein FB451DRAFT_1518811 [Mycena latifolia]|nr:hypothetical protein FB451DRAFT_1518811 [Mycena latifolia]